MTPAVRPMRHADLPVVSEIEKACFGERWSQGAFANELDNSASAYFTLTESGEIIGYAGYWLILEEAHITTIGVSPAHQGKGLGEYLLLHLIEHAKRAQAKWITLEVRASNEVAQNLYKKYGFTSLGRRKAYYQDNREDALVMWTENIWEPVYTERLETLKRRFEERLSQQP